MTEAIARRYQRQELIDGFGTEGQHRLAQSKVAVIGSGGLGSPILTYLTAAGVGSIRLFDSDVVEESNLNRQVLFTSADIGKPKAEVAGERLTRLNPQVRVSCHRTRIGRDSAVLLRGVDHVIDAVDNLATRAALSEIADQTRVPVTFSAIESWRGLIHTYDPADPQSACFHCVFGDDIEPRESPIPVLGAAVGSLGAMTAVSVVRRIVFGDVSLARSIVHMSFDSSTTRRMTILPRSSCRCALRTGVAS